MKKIIKIISIIFMLYMLFGCSKSAPKEVEKYLDKYISLNDEVITSIDKQVKEENLNEENSKLYKEILKKQYSNLEYEITSEEYNGDEAIITVKITVYDLYKSSVKAQEYLINNPDEFGYNTEQYDLNKFIKYKLDLMNKQEQRIDYTIDFFVINTSDGWTISDLSNEDLEKIHGIYNYES